MKITNTEVYGFEASSWFSDCDVGIRIKKNAYELNVTKGKGTTEYVGRFKTLEEAKKKRKEFYIDMFIDNVSKYDVNIESIKEISYCENYFVSEEGFIFNKFGIKLIGAINKNGYHEINIKGKNLLVHRVIMKVFNNINNCDELDINHINGNKLDNSIDNLEWCTRSENVKHSYKNRLQDNVTNQYGNFRVVSSEDIRTMKLLKEEGKTQKEIAEEVGFCVRTIRKYLSRG